ncbi:hypothetical protein ACS0TY_017999 [Phlomoides rotata]
MIPGSGAHNSKRIDIFRESKFPSFLHISGQQRFKEEIYRSSSTPRLTLTLKPPSALLRFAGMAVQCPKMTLRVTEVGSSLTRHPLPWQINFGAAGTVRKLRLQTIALSGDGKKPAATPNSNYVVPLDKSSCITRPLAEILRDLNKRVPDNIIKTHDSEHPTSIPWYQANRMLSFYAPGKVHSIHKPFLYTNDC